MLPDTKSRKKLRLGHWSQVIYHYAIGEEERAVHSGSLSISTSFFTSFHVSQSTMDHAAHSHFPFHLLSWQPISGTKTIKIIRAEKLTKLLLAVISLAFSQVTHTQKNKRIS